ncbi:aminotransferase class III-fold pyridoxal phosphate-dependent enzyme [Undibacterium arcticum]
MAQAPVNTRAIQDLDAAHYLHPFTDSKALASHGSRVIVKGEGIYIWDSEGKRLLDGMSGLWCMNVGYGRKSISDAVYAQMQQLPFYNSFFSRLPTCRRCNWPPSWSRFRHRNSIMSFYRFRLRGQ